MDDHGGRAGNDMNPDDARAIGLGFTEAELTELAMAGDADAPLEDDAVPLSVYLGQDLGLLPQWYMPSPMAHSGKRWRTPVVLVIVAAFIVLEAFGLCSTFGQVVPA